MKLLFTLILLGTCSAYAGNGSHGGDAVICPGTPDHVYNYDYYMTTDLNPNLKPDLGGGNLDYLQKAELAVRRLAKTLSPA